MRRSYSLPLTTITLGLGTGCTPDVIGVWSMDSITFDGDTYTLPLVETYTYEGTTYTYTYTGELQAFEGGNANITLNYTYEVDGVVESEASTYTGTWHESGSSFKIEVEGYDLLCSVDDLEMDCDGDSFDSDGNAIPTQIALSLQDAL